jgi:hypothetical protein
VASLEESSREEEVNADRNNALGVFSPVVAQRDNQQQISAELKSEKRDRNPLPILSNEQNDSRNQLSSKRAVAIQPVEVTDDVESDIDSPLSFTILVHEEKEIDNQSQPLQAEASKLAESKIDEIPMGDSKEESVDLELGERAQTVIARQERKDVPNSTLCLGFFSGLLVSGAGVGAGYLIPLIPGLNSLSPPPYWVTDGVNATSASFVARQVGKMWDHKGKLFGVFQLVTHVAAAGLLTYGVDAAAAYLNDNRNDPRGVLPIKIMLQSFVLPLIQQKMEKTLVWGFLAAKQGLFKCLNRACNEKPAPEGYQKLSGGPNPNR